MSLLPKNVLPSVRNQWFMTPYSFGMLGNFDYVNEGCLVLDDGTVWFLQPEMGGPVHIANNDWHGAIGTVGPEGWTKWSGDHWTKKASKNQYGAYAMADEYYIWDTVFPSNPDTSTPRVFTTDGRYIYYSMAPSKDGPFGNAGNSGGRFYRLDPQTGLCTWIAGAEYVSSSYSALDSHDGRLAQIPNLLFSGSTSWTWTCDREYIYWIEELPGATYVAGRLRRMKLQSPYPVETIFSSYDLSFADRWTIQGDGFPAKFRSDYLEKSGADQPMGHYGDYLYIGQSADLRRIPKDGGSVETILYGGKSDRAPTWEDSFSRSCGWSDKPTRHWEGWTSSFDINASGNRFVLSNWDSPGIPDLEGLEMIDLTSMKSVGNRLFFVNSSGTEGSSSTNWWGKRFAYFDMDVLLDTYAKEGPQKPNREEPQWESISNGTAMWEGETGINNCLHRDQLRICGRSENVRAGSEPLHGHMGNLFDFNPHAAPPWNERLVFLHMETNFIGHGDWLEYGYNTGVQIGWGCSYLEERGTGPNSQYNLSIQFTGDLLKGYAAAREVKSPQAPEQVDLQEVDSG